MRPLLAEPKAEAHIFRSGSWGRGVFWGILEKPVEKTLMWVGDG